MKTTNLFLGLFIWVVATSCNTTPTYDSIFSRYENIDKPSLFAEELTLKGNTYKGSFSNDYSTFYFFRHNKPDQEDYHIFQTTFLKNQWTDPKDISFSDANSDLYPMISTINKNELFIISYRRTPADSSQKPNANFWVATKVNSHWEKPIPFTQANLIYNYNSQPCITTNGTIYFTSDTPDWSKRLTYKMEYKNGSYQNPSLFSPINEFRAADTTRTIFEICVSPDESYMILTISENRQDAKLFVSRKIDNEWTSPIYIGDIIEDDMSGNFPYITADGKFLIFTRGFSFFYILPTKVFANKE